MLSVQILLCLILPLLPMVFYHFNLTVVSLSIPLFLAFKTIGMGMFPIYHIASFFYSIFLLNR